MPRFYLFEIRFHIFSYLLRITGLFDSKKHSAQYKVTMRAVCLIAKRKSGIRRSHAQRELHDSNMVTDQT